MFCGWVIGYNKGRGIYIISKGSEILQGLIVIAVQKTDNRLTLDMQKVQI